MHHKLNTFCVSIIIEHLKVEIGIRSNKVEDIAFPHIRPIFPTDIPSFNKHFIKSVLGSKIDIALHLLIVCSMTTVGLNLSPIDIIKLYAWKLVGIVPRTLSNYHLPPHSTVFSRMYPGGVFQLTWFIEIKNKIRGENFAGIIANHHRAPRRDTRRLHGTFQARCIGSQMTHKGVWLRKRPLR